MHTREFAASDVHPTTTNHNQPQFALSLAMFISPAQDFSFFFSVLIYFSNMTYSCFTLRKRILRGLLCGLQYPTTIDGMSLEYTYCTTYSSTASRCVGCHVRGIDRNYFVLLLLYKQCLLVSLSTDKGNSSLLFSIVQGSRARRVLDVCRIC